jgi:hypothetical protein
MAGPGRAGSVETSSSDVRLLVGIWKIAFLWKNIRRRMSTLLASVGLRCVAWRSGALHDGVMEKWKGIGRLGSQPRLSSHLNLAPDSVKAFLSTSRQTLLKHSITSQILLKQYSGRSKSAPSTCFIRFALRCAVLAVRDGEMKRGCSAAAAPASQPSPTSLAQPRITAFHSAQTPTTNNNNSTSQPPNCTKITRTSSSLPINISFHQ